MTTKSEPKKHNRSTYANHRCRCETCTEDWRAYNAQRRAERRAMKIPDDVEHGRTTYTNWGCRCGICTTEWATYWRELRRSQRAAAKISTDVS